MNREIIFIPLPKNISFSVFEALRVHVHYFEESNFKVIYLSRNKNINDKNIIYFNSFFKVVKYLKNQKKGIIYSITVIEVVLSFISNILGAKKQIIFWVQGLIDEEDFFSNKKKYRYYIYNLLMRFSLKVSDKLILVTNEMQRVLKTKYNLSINKKYLILNCVSRVKYNNVDKIKNSLCYIGGLSNWQNVDKILLFFNKLTTINNTYTLHIATFDHKEAKQLINKYVNEEFRNKIFLENVKEKEEVAEFLSKMEYGFLIRDNVLLNNVASPIKLAEYLSCGVNPIISDSLIDFSKIINESKCGIVITNDNFDEAIDNLLKFTPNLTKAIKLYNDFFELKSISDEIKYFLKNK